MFNWFASYVTGALTFIPGGFNFFFHHKCPLLSYDLNTVNLNDKDVKSLPKISS